MDADREETAPAIPVIAGEAEPLWIMISSIHSWKQSSSFRLVRG